MDESRSHLLPWEIRVKSNSKRLQHFNKSQELCGQHCPLTETGTFSAKREMLSAYKAESFLGRKGQLESRRINVLL